VKTQFRGWLIRCLEPQVLFPALTVVVVAIIWVTTFAYLRMQRADIDRASQVSTREIVETYEAQVMRALDQIDQALNVVSETVNQSAPEIQASFEGIARLSESVASRDAQIQHLLRSSRDVSTLLADRSTDLVDLMQNSSLVFEEVERRKAAIHRLLVNARVVAVQLKGVATDNQDQIKPALKEVDDLLSLLNSKDKELKATLDALGPYASILGNIIGTGPWFDAYAVNLAAIPTGEFLPGPPD